ncbi:MAG: anti-sigma factor [Chloroflexota bacterium]|nr:anti-sigma factor [Chloroflexota bacterium]
MNDELTHQEILDLLPAYVLGALEPEEMLTIDRYLTQQHQLLAELEELESATAQLAYTAPEASLPSDAKRRLMARVQADLQGEVPASARRETERDNTVLGMFRRWFSNLWLWRSAAALSLVVLLFLLLYTSQLQEQLGEVEEQVVELEQDNQALVQQLELNQQRLAILLTSQRVVVLPGTEAAPDAQGIFCQSGNQGLLAWQGLEPLSEEQSYELWLIPAEGAPVPAGLFAVEDIGPSSTPIDVPSDVEYATVGVSVEPRGGSEQPTGPIVLLGEVGAAEPES